MEELSVKFSRIYEANLPEDILLYACEAMARVTILEISSPSEELRRQENWDSVIYLSSSTQDGDKVVFITPKEHISQTYNILLQLWPENGSVHTKVN